MTHGMGEMTTRRQVLGRFGFAAGLAAVGGGALASRAWGGAPITIGVATDLTGPIDYAGQANANVARVVVDDLNARGGLLGRRLDLVVVDTGSDPKVGSERARELVQRHNPAVVLGGITSAMRDAIKAPIVDHGILYIYPQLYEGGECHPNIFCTGPTPNQQVDPLVPWLIANGGKRFYLPASDYAWPHGVNRAVKAAVRKHGGEIVGEEYFPIDAMDFAPTVNRITSSGAAVVFNTVIPPGLTPFLAQLHEAGFTRRGGRLACIYFDENLLNVVAPEQMEGLASCLDYFEAVDDKFSQDLASQYRAKFPGGKRFAAGSAATGMYRGVTMWANAVKEAGSLEATAVRKALDHAKIAQGPGGPAEMVPGQHHVRTNMYIAVARKGRYDVVKKLGMIEPRECVHGVGPK